MIDWNLIERVWHYFNESVLMSDLWYANHNTDNYIWQDVMSEFC